MNPPTPPSLIALGDGIEAAAFRDMYQAAAGLHGLPGGVEVEEHEGVTLLLARGIPEALFNRAIGLGLHHSPSTALLDAITARYQAVGARHYWLHVSPGAHAQDLVLQLRARGYVAPPRRSWIKVRHAGGALPRIPTDILIRPARPAEHAQMAAVVTQAFGMPPFMQNWLAAMAARPGWQCFVAEERGMLIGGGMLFIKGDCAWLGVGGVLPSHRRRGAHANLMLARIAAAQAAGCRHIFTETGEPIASEPNPSLINMHRCGFEPLCSRLNFAGPVRP